MENVQHMQLDQYNHMPVVIEGTSPQLLSESHLRSNFFQLSNQNDRMIGVPVGQSFKDLHADKVVNYDGLINRVNYNYQELCLGGTSFATGSLGTLLTSKNGPNSDVCSSVVPLQEVASDSYRAMYSSSSSYASSSSVPSPLPCGYDSLAGDVNNRWDQNRFLIQPELNWRTSTSGVEPVQYSEIQDANEWGLTNSMNGCSSHAYGTLRSQNELSLSLATAGPSFPCPESIQDQCSDMQYSGIFHSSQSQRSVGAGHSSQRSQCNKELSLGRASSSQSAQFSQLLSGSRYRAVLQQILSELASYSLETVDRTSYSAGNLISSSSNLPFCSDQFGTNEYNDNDGSAGVPAGSSRTKQELESKKSQLFSLLQVVDDQHNRCLDQLHTVISAFHAATELDPQLHACFALQSVSVFYKSLRQRISNQILELGMDSEGAGDSRRSFEKSFIQKQWALQQLKKKDQQLWKPQRGLPERSVSVLRAWMFDNFLHPYPKDAEKHLLAIKSGLSRSQVSNWFINARVRLWKPLVEEMCAELNRRKNSRQNDEGSNNRSNQLSVYDFNQRLNT